MSPGPVHTADPARRGPRVSEDKHLDSIVYFSDAVFAIAITLLILSIEVPGDGPDLGGRLLDLWPQALSFAISFLVIGKYWFAHHRLWRHIVRYDSVLIWLNLLLLMVIASLPFASELLGLHGDTTVAVVVYAGWMIAAGLLSTLVWWYATRDRRLVDDDLDARFIHHFMVGGLVFPAIFAVSVPVAFVQPTAATLTWLAIIPARRIVAHRYHSG